MRLDTILLKNDVTLSFEVFPPKVTANYESVKEAAYGVAKLKPSYMSVTYGAGGSTGGNTLKLAKGIQEEYGVTTIAHLTCVGATKEGILQALAQMREAGIENVLALRGDRPKDFEGDPFTTYHYASELVERQSPEDVDAMTGASSSGSNFVIPRDMWSQRTHRRIF